MSVTGQVGYLSIAKQTAVGTPNTTSASYQAIKITGDSLVANNNMLVAEGEIGTGRDISQAIPGGFSSAGAINGNLRVKSAAVFLEASLGTVALVAADSMATPPTAAVSQYTPADDLPYLTIEKKIGSVSPELIYLRYVDSMVNTFNVSIPSGGLATFSAGLITAGETKQAAAADSSIDYTATTDDLLAFHGGRIRHADSGTVLTNTFDDSTFQTCEVVINNNVASDEYTIRPSRFLRSLTEGIRSIELNLTIIFEDAVKYEKYTYGATGRTTPGYSLYTGAIEIFLGNWQPVSGAGAADQKANTATITGGPTNPQALEVQIPKLAFSGLPIALQSGRIAVSTTARALKPTTTATNIISAIVRPSASGLV